MTEQYYEGIGRRKEATARVRLMKGSGQFIVNQKELAEFFPRMGDADEILRPLGAAELSPQQYDVSVLVKGGGITGQTSAVRLGLTRALIKMNPDLTPVMRKNGFTTRDARVKERKKPGLKRARKAPTYTKR